MAVYRIAGLFVEMEPRYDHLKNYAEKYLFQGEVGSSPININVSDAYLEKKRLENPRLSIEDCEYIWTGAEFAHKLLKNNGFVLHSSAISYKGQAYLFSADSGTGKSTHTEFWREVFGKDEVVTINDDKPAVREIDGTFYAMGSPFSGKSPLNRDVACPIRCLCFIYRSEVNEIKKIDPSDSLQLLLGQTVRPSNPENAALLLNIIDRFLRKTPVFSLGVTYSPESACFAYTELNKMI